MAVLGCAAVELGLGQLATAGGSAQQALGVLRAIGGATWTSVALAGVARIERTRRRLETAGRNAAEALDAGRRANSAFQATSPPRPLWRRLRAPGRPRA